MGISKRSLAVTLALLGLWACADAPPDGPASLTGIDASFDHVAVACDLKDAKRAAGKYVPQPERKEVRDLLEAIEEDCSQPNAGNRAWQVNEIVAFVAGRSDTGPPSEGAFLVNEMLGCIEHTCQASVEPADRQVEAGALDVGGTFAVVGDLVVDGIQVGVVSDPVLSRDAIPLRADGSNLYWPGVEPDPDGGDWAQELFGPDGGVGLVWGLVSPAGPETSEHPVVESPYDFHFFSSPEQEGFFGQVGVGFCFRDVTPGEEVTRLQGDGVLVQLYEPSFCDQLDWPTPALSLASALTPILELARRIFLSQPLLAAMFDEDPDDTSTGGLRSAFSTFLPVEADPTSENLTLESTINGQVFSPGNELPPITVTAETSNETPIELFVTVAVFGNNGEPAGAFLVGETTHLTSETEGSWTFTGLSIDKSGGYTVCATADDQGFTFNLPCTEMFWIRGN